MDGDVTGGAVGAYGGGVTIAAEGVQDVDHTLDMDSATNGPDGHAAGDQIVYIPSFGLNSGDILTLSPASHPVHRR